MSRYTDLMKKKTMTDQEKNEFFKLILEEFDREERRINKLPINRTMRHESLLNVINAHLGFLKSYMAGKKDDDPLFNELTENQYWSMQRIDDELDLESNKEKDEVSEGEVILDVEK